MTSVEPTGERVVRPAGFDLAEAWKLITDEVDQRRAPLRANTLASGEVVWDLRHMFGTRVRIGPTTPDGRVEVELRGQSPWLLAAEIAGFGSLVEVLDPTEVREQLSRLASELATTYGIQQRPPYDQRMTPEEHFRAAGAAYQDDDLIECRRQAEAAFRGFRDRGDLCAAGRVAISLAELHDNALGQRRQPAADGSTGLGARSSRSVRASSGATTELAYMACDRPDVDELEASADRALAIALEFHDHNLEVRSAGGRRIGPRHAGSSARGVRSPRRARWPRSPPAKSTTSTSRASASARC